MSNVPRDLRYAASHEWLSLDGDIATIGITDFAQSELGDIVFVEVTEVGRALTKGDSFGTVESVKSVSDVYAPVSGTVVEVNAALQTDTELVNRDPYGKGYLLKIKVNDVSEVEGLLDADGYEAVTH